MNLDDFKFTKEHEWIKVEGDIGIIGISDFAQKEFGDIVYVELPSVGEKIKKGDACANIESVKAVDDIYTPISGEIIEINEELENNPENINKDPNGNGWIIKIKIEDKKEIENLMNNNQYNDFLNGIS
jgi:glycine cleavage system H protein